MKSHLVVLCALLAPAVARAQAPVDPNDPDASTAPAPTPPTTTVTVEPTPAPPTPVIVVNPPAQPAPRTMVPVTQYETVYDSYNAPVFTTGALVFVASYGGSVIAAASASKEQSDRGIDRLYVPVVGPWLALNDRGSCPIESSSCDNETTIKVLLVADGVFQAAGVVAMVTGVLQPRGHRVPVQTVKLDTKVRVTPTAMAGQGGGFAVFGRF